MQGNNTCRRAGMHGAHVAAGSGSVSGGMSRKGVCGHELLLQPAYVSIRHACTRALRLGTPHPPHGTGAVRTCWSACPIL